MSDASKIDDGIPAFPQNEFSAYTLDRAGLTKRDYFAAAALPAVIAAICEGHIVAKGDVISNEAMIARQAIAFADALIAASKSEAHHG